MAVDFSKSYQTVEGTEAVTYFQRATESTFSPALGTPFSYAKRRAPNKSDNVGPGGALLFGVELIWHVWPIDLGSIVPKVGDVIQDAAGKRWVVLSVGVHNISQRYRLATAKEI